MTKRWVATYGARFGVSLLASLSACVPSDFDGLDDPRDASGPQIEPPIDAPIDAVPSDGWRDDAAAFDPPATSPSDATDAATSGRVQDASMPPLSGLDAALPAQPDAALAPTLDAAFLPALDAATPPDMTTPDASAPCACPCSDARCSNESGCSDGSREVFLDQMQFPTIAGCGALWANNSMAAARTGQRCGDDLAQQCVAPEDACALGWHVCGRNGARDLSDRISLSQCNTQYGKWAAALTDYGCDPCADGPGNGAVCCGSNCITQGGTCVWPGKTPWFNYTGDHLNSCASIGNLTNDQQMGVLCCRD